ncbi:vesicular glutamate transporter 2 [Eurytemora carolleeae]|uniref:vesicular glutamate transporter 2 n=1 Tax=Eurytemora carolleeae TaxID=1294199 RepID=UPI000C77DA6A|nr:vesicular glutamate transporter 2 [Eurytemora carolleeae]|eukprot:XP_023347883.1 vesicular glutamate transporter 2-like [Eurytemora affinis]
MLSRIIPRRWQVAILVFLGLMVNYMLRVNLNIALIEMNNSNNSMGPFVNWTDYGEGKSSDENVKSAQSLVKSAFFFGYVITQVPGGRFAEMFGTKKVFGISMMLCALLGALIPPLCTGNIKTSLMVWFMFYISLMVWFMFYSS